MCQNLSLKKKKDFIYHLRQDQTSDFCLACTVKSMSSRPRLLGPVIEQRAATVGRRRFIFLVKRRRDAAHSSLS